MSGVLIVYNDFERLNPPVEFIDFDGRWHYRMTLETAAVWRAVRALEEASPTAGELANVAEG